MWTESVELISTIVCQPKLRLRRTFDWIRSWLLLHTTLILVCEQRKTGRQMNAWKASNQKAQNDAFCVGVLCMSTLYYLPANKIRPISSLRPILSKSITMTSSEHSRIFSHGTLKLNDSLNTGFSVHLNIGVFRFSMRLSPNWSQTLTYGSEL